MNNRSKCSDSSVIAKWLNEYPTVMMGGNVTRRWWLPNDENDDDVDYDAVDDDMCHDNGEYFPSFPMHSAYCKWCTVSSCETHLMAIYNQSYQYRILVPTL